MLGSAFMKFKIPYQMHTRTYIYTVIGVLCLRTDIDQNKRNAAKLSPIIFTIKFILFIYFILYSIIYYQMGEGTARPRWEF
jgi:hypothetical protein